MGPGLAMAVNGVRLPAMVPRVTGLPFFVYPVADMARARRFYREVLGLAEGEAWADQWVEFDVGGGTLALSRLMAGCAPGTSGAAGLEVEDFEAMVAHLRSAGVKFILEPADTGVCRFARFLDSEGNHLCLHRKHG